MRERELAPRVDGGRCQKLVTDIRRASSGRCLGWLPAPVRNLLDVNLARYCVRFTPASLVHWKTTYVKLVCLILVAILRGSTMLVRNAGAASAIRGTRGLRVLCVI